MSNFIVLIVFIIIGVPVIAKFASEMHKRHLEYKERQEERHGKGAASDEEWVARVERLEDRVRVLERIITDKGHHLAEEIEKLRDKPLN
ncbi:MAG: hypothetical protein PVF65_04050 [Sphingomonadales bacterium]|jgi:hypothetical protein